MENNNTSVEVAQAEGKRWTVTDRYLSGKRITLAIDCPCGAGLTAFEGPMRASGKRCIECGGKLNGDGTYTPPPMPGPLRVY
jgi:hypothetical protein